MSEHTEKLATDFDYFCKFMLDVKIKEPDTYTLLPNGDNNWIVQHDQSGTTIPYMKKQYALNNYLSKPEVSYKATYFVTYASWSNTARGNWKRKQEAKERPMHITTLDCIPCVNAMPQPVKQPPIEHSNDYIKWVLDPYMTWWDVPTLRDELEVINDIIEDDDFDDECFEDHLETRRLLTEAIAYFNTKGNNKMYATSNTAIVAAAQPESIDQREYLINRLYTLTTKKRQELHKHFKLNPVKGPKTLKELIEKIKSEDYTLPDCYSDESEFYSISGLISEIRWSKDKPDQKGYDEASNKLDAAVADVTDTIKILSPEEGLKALKAFETQTFH